jgi:hypothetical protein
MKCFFRLYGGAFVGLGLRYFHQCLLQLILQSPAGGDNPLSEDVQLGWAFGQKSFDLGSPLGNFAVHALHVGGGDAPAWVELKSRSIQEQDAGAAGFRVLRKLGASKGHLIHGVWQSSLLVRHV